MGENLRDLGLPDAGFTLEEEGAAQASPYNCPFVIAGNGVGGLEIVEELKALDRTMSNFVCQVRLTRFVIEI